MAKAPTKAQRARWDIMRGFGCMICGHRQVEIHHCETGMGGRKNHDKCIPLCVNHHRGAEGIHTIGRKRWQAIYGTEQDLMELANMMANSHGMPIDDWR